MRSLRDLLNMWPDPKMKETIRSLWRDRSAGAPVDDTAIKVAFDFITSDELFFTYNCPVAMVFTSQESEFGDAIITPPLNTPLAQYDKVTITALETGLIVLNGHTL